MRFVAVLFLFSIFLPASVLAQEINLEDASQNELEFSVVTEDYASTAEKAPPPVPDYISNKRVTFTPQEREALRLAKKWEKNAIGPNIAMDGGKILFAYGSIIPTLVCAPLHISDLELERGESVNNIVLGDSARWHADIVQVGVEGATTPHIIFKPLDAGLETSVVITTNRRAYHINLKSQRDTFIPFSGFLFPVDLQQKITAAKAKVENKQKHLRNDEGIDNSKLDFDYEVTGDPSWKPIQIYNDGIKTYIKMPSSVAQNEMPVFLVEKDSGRVHANYRVRNNSYIVDQLFEKAVLLVGVGSDQESVTIEWRKS